MSAKHILHIHRCRLTGRWWVNLFGGALAVGFSGIRLDRVWWRKKLVWYRLHSK